MSQTTVKKVAGTVALIAIREDWTLLFSSTKASPFSSWEWIAAWCEKLGADREIYILQAFRDGKLIGILPLCRTTKSFLGMKFRGLGFLGEELGGADYLDLIAAEADKTIIWNAVFEFLATETDFDSIAFDYMAQSSGSILALENLCVKAGSLRFGGKITSVSPQIYLRYGWDEVLRGSKRKDNFKRRLKKLEKMDGFEFRSVTARDEIHAAFERFAVLHEKRWENDGGSDATGLPQLMEFHRTVIGGLAAQNLARFDELWVGGECRASVYGLDNGETFYYYNAGYDLTWADKSVGMVLIGCSIRAAIERGNRVYDFLRGEEPYKFDWSNAEEKLVSVRLSRPGLIASIDGLLESAWTFSRDVARAVLPAELAARLQNFRRNRIRSRKAV